MRLIRDNFVQEHFPSAFFPAAQTADDQLHQLHGLGEGEGLFTGAQPMDKQIQLLFEAVVAVACLQKLCARRAQQQNAGA